MRKDGKQDLSIGFAIPKLINKEAMVSCQNNPTEKKVDQSSLTCPEKATREE